MMPPSTALVRASLTRVLAAGVLWLVSAEAAGAAGLTLEWDPNSEPQLSGYMVSYGTSPGAPTGSVIVTSSVSRVRLENLSAGTRYYVVVRALGGDGQFSLPSAEVNGVAGDTLPPAPTGSAQTYYAEGAAGFFDYRVGVLNTAANQTWLNVSFLREGAVPVMRS